MIDKFCEWFEGEFDNWTQAASNPTKWAHIIVKHEKLDDYNIDNLIVTKGSKGCIYNNTLYPAEKVNVYDVVGAGDTFLAALVYGYITTNNIDESLMMGNRAAAIAVQQPGTYILTEEDVQKILR